MKRLISLLAVLLIGNAAYPQIKIDEVRYNQLWSDGDYQDLLDEVNGLIKNQVYGKHWKLHYFAALALCGLGADTVATLAFDYIESEFPLKESQILFVSNGRKKCFSHNTEVATNPGELLLEIMTGPTSLPESVSAGKMGYVFDCTKKNELFEFSAEFDQREMRNRLFDIDQQNDAIQYYEDFLPVGKYSINASGRYIIITPQSTDINQDLIDNAAKELEQVYIFYYNFYEIRPPDKLITVYFMGNKKNLDNAAMDTHGLKLPSGNIGYSNLSDLSVLGNSTKEGIGTIKHELFHLMVRTDLGDIPGWLDEGIASLYEESHFEGNILKSDTEAWRTKVLKQAAQNWNPPITSLYELIENNWKSLMPNYTSNICELSVNYAVAKHFAIYMEEQGLLKEMVEAFKNRKTVFVNLNYKNESALDIVERVFNANIDEIQLRFNKWLDDKYNIVYDYSLNNIGNSLHLRYSIFSDLYHCEDSVRTATQVKYESIMEKMSSTNSLSGNPDKEEIRTVRKQALTFINEMNKELIKCNL